MNWSQSSVRTPAVHYIVCWLPCTLIWGDSDPIACYFWSLLSLLLCTIIKYEFWAGFLVGAIAALRWTNWCLRCCWVAARGILDEVPIIRLDLDLITPAWGVCEAVNCCGGKGDKDDHEKWNIQRNILYTTSHNGITDSHLAQSTQVLSEWG
jgi:hypothetical protein